MPVPGDRAQDLTDELACFGWSQRAWARPWRAWRQSLPGVSFERGLEVGAGAHSSLSPLMLQCTRQVDCSYFDAAQAVAIRQLHERLCSPAQASRIRRVQHDVRDLVGRWDVIVMKSVLGGVFRVGSSSTAEMRSLLATLVNEHLNPGGWLVTLDNGQTALEPLLRHFGARRNGWRFLRHEDFAPAQAFHSFGVLGAFSAATRLGWLGQRVDDVVYGADRLLTPLTRRHAVMLHAYRKPG